MSEELGSKLEELQNSTDNIRQQKGAGSRQRSMRSQIDQRHQNSTPHDRNPRARVVRKQEQTASSSGGLDTTSIIAVILLVLIVGPGWGVIQENYGTLIVALYGNQGDGYDD